MNRTLIEIKTIYKLTKKFASSLRRKRLRKSESRGRPEFYPDALFMTMSLVRQLYGYSYRETLKAVSSVLKLKFIPAVSTLHYRLSKMPASLFIEFHNFVVNWILSNYRDSIKLLIVDATGFSFNELYPARFFRGKEIRFIKSHVRMCVIIGVMEGSGKRIVLAMVDGGPYESEVKMVMHVLSQLENMAGVKLSGIPFIADKGYDSVRVIERVLEMGLEPYIKIRESFRHGVKDELRLLSKRNVESGDGVYRERYLVESLFGTIKSKLSSHIYARREDMARKEALARMILWNIYILEEIRGYFFLFAVFLLYLIKKYPKHVGVIWKRRSY